MKEGTGVRQRNPTYSGFSQTAGPDNGVNSQVAQNFNVEGRENPGTGATKSVPPVTSVVCIDGRGLSVGRGGREP